MAEKIPDAISFCVCDPGTTSAELCAYLRQNVDWIESATPPASSNSVLDSLGEFFCKRFGSYKKLIFKPNCTTVALEAKSCRS